MAEQLPIETNAMKDGLNAAAIERIGKSIARVMPHFNADKFQSDAEKGIGSLELKARVQHLIHILHTHYNVPFITLCEYLHNLPSVWDSGNVHNSKASFAAWPVIDYIAVHGLTHPQESLLLLEKLTPLFTAEFAVRPFIQAHPELAYNQLLKWCENENEHVRRLASEASRPRLPWGMRLSLFINDPQPLRKILEKLKADDSLYVRRSVANNLNDIGKDHPDWVIEICYDWKQDNNEKTNWIIKHALRSLIKAGNPRVFPLLGYAEKPNAVISALTLKKNNIAINTPLEFSFTVDGGDKTECLVIDYVIYFMKANGRLSPKVFKLKNVSLPAHTQLSINKKHSFKLITTRTYYAGKHEIAIHINGKEMVRTEFSLVL